MDTAEASLVAHRLRARENLPIGCEARAQADADIDQKFELYRRL